jgi:hypothetical protein
MARHVRLDITVDDTFPLLHVRVVGGDVPTTASDRQPYDQDAEEDPCDE